MVGGIGKVKKLLFVTALAAASAAPAYAGTLNYNSYSFTGIGSVTIDSPTSITGGAGPITLYENGVPVVTDAWCMDVASYLAGSATVGTEPFTLTNADGGLPGVPTTLTATQLGVISWLVDIGDHTSDGTLQGAIQVAIWSEEYGSNFTYDAINGAFTTDVSTDLSEALADDTAHGDAPLALTFLVPGGDITSQILVFSSPVPELSTWAMMLIGFVGLGYAGYRKGKSADGVRGRLAYRSGPMRRKDRIRAVFLSAAGFAAPCQEGPTNQER